MLPANLGPGYAEKGVENVKKAFVWWRDVGRDSEDCLLLKYYLVRTHMPHEWTRNQYVNTSNKTRS